VALKGRNHAMAEARGRYRIERRHDGITEVLADTSDEQAPETALAPPAEVLTARLAPGELVLIEQRSGHAVARHALWTPPATRERR
jgi:hypothetical protein